MKFDMDFQYWFNFYVYSGLPHQCS